MAGEKMVQKYYGPKGLIERLKDRPLIKWSPLETSLEGFEFDGNRLHDEISDEASITKAKYQLKVTDKRTGEEFLIEGFCCPSLLSTFFLNEAQWKLVQIAGFYMSSRLMGTSFNPYIVSMEVLTQGPHAD